MTKRTSDQPGPSSRWLTPWTPAAVLFGVVTLTAALACSGRPPRSDAPTSVTPSAGAPLSPSASRPTSSRSGPVASAASAFTLPTVGGGTLSASAERGRVVVLNFTAPDCPTCAEQIPVLDRVAARFAASGVTVAIVDVSGGDDDATLAAAYRDYGWTERVPIGKDLVFAVAQAFRVTRMGETVILDRGGAISWKGVWEDEEPLVEAIERALGS